MTPLTSPTTPHTAIITWSLTFEEVDEIFREFDLFFFFPEIFFDPLFFYFFWNLYFLEYTAWMGFQSSDTRCFSDIKMLFIGNGKRSKTRNYITKINFPIYFRLLLWFYLIQICYKTEKWMSTTRFTKKKKKRSRKPTTKTKKANPPQFVVHKYFLKIHPLCQHFGWLYSIPLPLMLPAVSTTPSWGFQCVSRARIRFQISVVLAWRQVSSVIQKTIS